MTSPHGSHVGRRIGRQGYRRPFPPRRAAGTRRRGMRVHEASPIGPLSRRSVRPPSPARYHGSLVPLPLRPPPRSSLAVLPSHRSFSSCSILYHHLQPPPIHRFRADPKTLQTERTRNECVAAFPNLSSRHSETENALLVVESGREKRERGGGEGGRGREGEGGRKRRRRGREEKREGGGKELGEGGEDRLSSLCP